MLQKIRTMLFVLCAALSGPAFANCMVIDQLDKLYVLQSRMMNNPATGLFATDMRQLRTISSSLSDGSVLNAVGGNSFLGKGARFVGFVADTRTLLQSVSLDDPNSVRPHFTAARRARLSAVGSDLNPLRCTRADVTAARAEAATNASEEAGTATTDADDLRDVTQTLARVADEIFQIRTVLVLVFIGAAVAILTPLIRSHLILRQRRAKRHTTKYRTQYDWGDVVTNGTLLDINCFGTKLRHEAETAHERNKDITIRIDDKWVTGTIMWSNDHYSGVQFKRAITLDDVSAVRFP